MKMKDGIDDENIHNSFITIVFNDEDKIDLSVFDLFFNLMFWYLIIRSNQTITPQHLFFPDSITGDSIKSFIDKYFILKVRTIMDGKIMNNIIDDALHFFSDVDNFSFYLANTINLKDTIDLMNASPEFDIIMHSSLKDVPIEDVKNKGMELTNRSIDIIINDSKRLLGHDHCLKNSFLANEGINRRQYKEFAINIGTKPNGNGGVHPAIIDNSYIGAGLNNLVAQYIDSSSSRVAQVQTKEKTGSSGNFARILGINNIDSNILDDPDYDCGTNNFIELIIKSKKVLHKLIDRYYRLVPDGIDYLISENDTFLIGKKIYLRSPITCASAARGNGVCFKCYGNLAYINKNIKPGKYAAERLSSILTQRQLSAKHLLETLINKLKWCKLFYKYFTTDVNIIQVNQDVEIPKGTMLLIDTKNINNDNDEYIKNDEDYIGGNEEYITEFLLEDKNGVRYHIKTEDDSELYISDELNEYICNYGNQEGEIIKLKLKDLADNEIPLFIVNISNNELSKTLKELQNLINKKNTTQKHTKDSIVQTMFDLCIEGNLDIMGVHLEMIIMNQIRDVVNVLRKPDWEIKDIPYQLLTLDQALKDNPSITISLLYKSLGNTLSYPLSYKKTSPSYMDLFFMKQPQNYLSNANNIVNNTTDLKKAVLVERVHKK
jgi:hypothetical protein